MGADAGRLPLREHEGLALLPRGRGCSACGSRQVPIALPGPRASATALRLARECGLDPLGHALASAIDATYQPTFDAVRGEFTWGFELDEE